MRGVQIRVGRRLVVVDVALLPVPRQQAVVALQVVLGPAPDLPERLAVTGSDRKQQRVGLTLADGVAALVTADDAALIVHEVLEEARGVAVRKLHLRRRVVGAAAAANDKGRRKQYGCQPPPHAGTPSSRSATARSRPPGPAAADSGAGAPGTRAPQTPATSTVMCMTANATLLSVAGEWRWASPYVAAPTSAASIASAGQTGPSCRFI